VDKKHRLTDNRQFQLVRKDGRTWVHRLVILGALPNGLAISRFGFATAKQINTAVARNRARRLLREAARQAQPRIASGWDLVFIARAPAAASHYREICAAVERLLQQARLLAQTPEGNAPS
jgi:ribonuclease P protein component